MTLTEETQAKICRLADEKGLLESFTNENIREIEQELKMKKPISDAVKTVLRHRIGMEPARKDGNCLLSVS